MSKMRVYEYAKQNNTTSKNVINILKGMNVEVSNHMSTISTDTIKKLDEKFHPDKAKKENSNSKPKKTEQQSNTGNNQSAKQKNTKREDRGKQRNSPAPKQQNKQSKNNYRKQKGNKGNRGKENKQAVKPIKETPKKITYSETLTVSD